MRAVGALRVPSAVQGRLGALPVVVGVAPLLRRWHPFLNALGMFLITSYRSTRCSACQTLVCLFAIQYGYSVYIIFDPRLFSGTFRFIPLASWVPVQRRRTDFPVVYSHRAAAHQFCVGWHWESFRRMYIRMSQLRRTNDMISDSHQLQMFFLQCWQAGRHFRHQERKLHLICGSETIVRWF